LLQEVREEGLDVEVGHCRLSAHSTGKLHGESEAKVRLLGLVLVVELRDLTDSHLLVDPVALLPQVFVVGVILIPSCIFLVALVVLLDESPRSTIGASINCSDRTDRVSVVGSVAELVGGLSSKEGESAAGSWAVKGVTDRSD